MMDKIYKVTIKAGEEENMFNITWQFPGQAAGTGFKVPGLEMTGAAGREPWQNLRDQLETGRNLSRFLDGDRHYLQQALEETARLGEPLVLYLDTCRETSDWPFELLVWDNSFLLPLRLHLVRCVSQWGTGKKVLPRDRLLKLLFMACSALDVQPLLDFEKEEEAIFSITRDLAVDMEVEDSGSLEGLYQLLKKNQYDIVHLSGHADIDKNGRAYFIMEDETGNRRDVYAHELWRGALVENPPRLLFLSGCRTGQTGVSGAAASFARLMTGQQGHGVPAVLGWGRPVSDNQAAFAAKMLYYELTRGKTIPEAVQRVRGEMLEQFTGSPNPAWPFLRLFSSGEPLTALVTKDRPGQQKLPPRRMQHTYLKDSRVQVLVEGFVGRRRQLQQSLRALKHDDDKTGLLLHGTGGLGKSCLAGKICERFSHHTLIIVHGKFNAITLEPALKDAFLKTLDETGEQILAADKEMTEKLARLCVTSFKAKNYLLLLDDFEQNLEDADKGQPGALLPESADLLTVLLHHLLSSGKMTQLIITCRYVFNLDDRGRDLVKARLEPVCLTSFPPAEQQKKARELKHIAQFPDKAIAMELLAAGRGNPRLMEWLDQLLGQMPETEAPRLLDAVTGKQEEFIRGHVIRELVRRGGKDLEPFLRRLGIYRLPVLLAGVHQVGKTAGLEQWRELLNLGIGLSLVEYDWARGSYGVTPLLREELLSGLNEVQTRSCHRAAFTYYQELGEAMKKFDPLLVEEWIFHAMGCGEEEAASRQGSRLVKNLRERLAFMESRRVGEWVLTEKEGKKQELSTGDDAFLLNELAVTIYDMGDHRKAIEYYELALATFKNVYGEKHQNVATALNNLGSAWYDLGDHRKAIEYFERALAIDEAVFGKEHPKVAIRLNNLGSAWKVLGDHRKAIEYFERALTIDEAVFGKEHPNVATGLNNLGEAWRVLGEPREAIKYFERALAIDEAVFGKEHPNVATGLNNLGSAWDDLGDHRKAIEYYERALAIDEAVFGKEHPKVAIRLNNLGSAYFDLEKTGKAKGYFKRAYGIFKKFLGEEHPHTKTIKANLQKCPTH